MSSFSLLLKKNFPLISLVLVIIVAFSAPLSLASPTTTTTTELPAINTTDAAAITTTTESFYDFLVRVAFSNTPSSARATTEAVTPPSNSLSFGILSPSGRIARSNLTIPEWVRTQRKPDVEALAISLSLMPEIRSELNSSVSRYSSLGWWDVYELPLDSTAPWDLLMAFLREYPQICDAFTNTSHYAKLPACLNRLYLEPRKKLIEDRTPWMCRTSPFASACTAQKALLGTGLNDAVVEMWQRRMRAFSLYQREVAPVQASRLVATEEASCYWYVFCLKVNAADDAGLRKCLDNVVKFGGLIH